MHPSSSRFFTSEDAKIALNLFCCIYGIGTLGMPGNFSRAGPLLGSFALLFMTLANVYATIACSRVMLHAPPSVKTFGDLGYYCLGPLGRYLVVTSQMAVCLLGPCVFLVLGGTLLASIFSNTFSQVTWLMIMVISVLPVCLTPTLKEGAVAAFAGCAGTLLADILGLTLLLGGMSSHPPPPAPELKLSQVVGAFGNLSLAFSAGVLIPALQRQHSDPKRMPKVIFVTMMSIAALFWTLSMLAYSTVGCQISGNLLFSIFPSASTGLSALGFPANRGIAVLSYLGMQIHITIAFAVFLHPAFYTLERLVLGMHCEKENVVMEVDDGESGEVKCIFEESKDAYEEEYLEYRLPGNVIRYIALRLVLIGVLVVVAVVFRDHLGEFMDFIGASCISMSCIILPIVFYLKETRGQLPLYEKVAAGVILTVCIILGAYVTYTSAVKLLSAPDHSIPFPYCKAYFKHELYYNVTSVRH